MIQKKFSIKRFLNLLMWALGLFPILILGLGFFTILPVKIAFDNPGDLKTLFFLYCSWWVTVGLAYFFRPAINFFEKIED